MNLLKRTINLNYNLPNKQSIQLDLSTEEMLGVRMNKNLKRLISCYEQDILFINKEVKEDIQDYLQTRYGRDQSKKAMDELRTLEAVVFAPVNAYLDKIDFSITTDQLMNYFSGLLDEEFERLKQAEFDPTLAYIKNSPQAESLMRSLLTQFSIEFLIEGAPMGLYATGAYGTLQSHLLRVYQDEMGNGIPQDKHSYLYEKTMLDLGLSDLPNVYEDFFLSSNMLVSAYTYQICHDKSKFLRYLGAFFRNEACFIVWQKQLGESVREVYNSRVDCHYFDVHTAVDQSHGRWVLNHLVAHALQRFGDGAASEILRGFVELMIYQDIYGLELDHQILTGPQARSVPSSLEPLQHHVSPHQTAYFFSNEETFVQLKEDTELYLLDPLTRTTAKEGVVVVPPLTAAHVRTKKNGVSYGHVAPPSFVQDMSEHVVVGSL